MPELPETMYCSEQISIPPTFPYLLRQYAKAAIRTQPIDLLRWSTAYFRCLSLNLKPPVKPRLEYPILKSHFGLTPGWLKALLHQLENNVTVPFPVSWDRWNGACLEYKNLIEMLCLGGFTQPNAIPWLRFIAICAAHLTDNLTQTMLLVCEIMTEEPDGGCAMITLETFIDLYKFLAAIDASKPQTLVNLYFTDSLLNIYREPVIEKVKESVTFVEEEVEEESVTVEEEEVPEVEIGPVVDHIGVVISCPDIATDDYKTEEYFLMMAESGEKSEEGEEYAILDEKMFMQTEAVEISGFDGEDEVSITKQEESEENILIHEVEEIKELEKDEPDELTGPSTELLDEATASEITFSTQGEVDIKEYLQEDEAEEGTAYADKQLEELKLLFEAPEPNETIEGQKVEEVNEVEEEETEVLKTGEKIYVEAVPGIGATVSKDLIEAVVKYMAECAKNQHGMVMPRNVRHFNCPPLEHLEY